MDQKLVWALAAMVVGFGGGIAFNSLRTVGAVAPPQSQAIANPRLAQEEATYRSMTQEMLMYARRAQAGDERVRSLLPRLRDQREMQLEIIEMVRRGASDDEIIDFLARRRPRVP